VTFDLQSKGGKQACPGSEPVLSLGVPSALVSVVGTPACLQSLQHAFRFFGAQRTDMLERQGRFFFRELLNCGLKFRFHGTHGGPHSSGWRYLHFNTRTALSLSV